MSQQNLIPFNIPAYLGSEDRYVLEAIKNKKLSGEGEFNKKCVELIKKSFPNAFVNLTPSCTAALEMAYLLIDLKPGDEVILPSFTFTSTATAVTLFGATPVFVGVDDTLNLDLSQLKQAITPKTKAICVVHYAGFSCDMDLLQSIVKEKSIFLIEDAAQSIGASYKGRPLGSFGDMSAFSFHETKNIVCGEGGAIVINNPSLFSRAEIIRDKGTDRQRFLRGEIDKYTWQDKGSSYLLGELSAAYLYAQLLGADQINDRRKQIFALYEKLLRPLAESGRISLPQKTVFNTYNGHIFYILTETEAIRDELQAYLKNRQIQSTVHYVPLHDAAAGIKYGVSRGDFLKTTNLSRRLLRLPLFYQLTDEQVHRVVDGIKSYFN